MTASDLRHVIDVDGCRLTKPMAEAVHSTLLLAATLPDDDYDAFRASTAFLIADRLQNGAGDDDLFWHWDAFQAHYRTLPGQDRAAVLQGYRQLQDDGRIALYDPPEGDWVATETTATVRRELEPIAHDEVSNPASQLAGLVLDALDGGDALTASALAWTNEAQVILALERHFRSPLIRGLRHIYESRSDWLAYPGRLFNPSETLPLMIPVIP